MDSIHDKTTLPHLRWQSSALGEKIIQSGLSSMQKLIPRQYFRVTLQVSGPPDMQYLKGFESVARIRIDRAADKSGEGENVVADAEWFPFAVNSIDLLIMPHVLEFSNEPHDVLREVSECVVPEGIVAIAGMNPHSMLGVKKNLTNMEDIGLEQAKFYSVIRVRDWMSLLGFDSIAGEYAFFRPPSEQSGRLTGLKKFEVFGARWWPGFGSVYVLVFRKKVMGVRMNGSVISRTLRKKRRVLSPVAERNE